MGINGLHLICGSYFEVDFGQMRLTAPFPFSLRTTFSHADKSGLYCRVFQALRPGVFI